MTLLSHSTPKSSLSLSLNKNVGVCKDDFAVYWHVNMFHPCTRGQYEAERMKGVLDSTERSLKTARWEDEMGSGLYYLGKFMHTGDTAK